VARSHSIIRSWLDLAKLAEDSAQDDWIFRGEPLGDEPLRPGAGRVAAGRRQRKAKIGVDDERAALERFKSDALPYLARTPPNDHHLEWLAIAQHHGMQTRILDWSESLLIAAFFAVEGAGTRRGGVIYGVKGLPTVGASDDPFSLQEVSVYRPPRLTARIAPQLSTFTVHPQPVADFRADRRVRTWRINGQRNCWQIKVVLDSCGVNYANIFPDIGGLARHIQWRYKWQMPQTRASGSKAG
jgi:hypothetical protein